MSINKLNVFLLVLAITVLMVLSLFQACVRDDLGFTKDALTITAKEQKRFANGYTKIGFAVKLLANPIDSANRRITIETNAGNFVNEKAPSNKINVYLESNREDSIYLIVGRIPGTFPVKAYITKLPQYQASIDVKLDTLRAADVLKITLDGNSKKANKVDIVSGTLKLSQVSNPKVTLSSTDAESLFVESNSAMYVPQITADGLINFKLKVGSVPGDYYIIARLDDERNFAIREKYSLTPLSSTDVLEFTDIGTGFRADNISIVSGRIKIKDTEKKEVQITTSIGVFLPAKATSVSVNVEPDGTKLFNLQVGNSIPDGASSVIYTLQAMSGKYSILKDVVVLPAYPSQIFIQPSKYSINKMNDEISLAVKLTRPNGLVSDGILLQFEASQDIAGVRTLVGRFKDSVPSYSRSQSVSVKFATDTRFPDASLPIQLKVSYLIDDGTLKSEIVNILVNP